MYAFADKLLEVSERHADEIAAQWCKAVKSNPHTPWYQAQKSETCNLFAMDFYKNFRSVYFDEKPYKKLEKYFTAYAEESLRTGVPLEEAVYALIMMRRQLWLFADFQALFVTAMDQHRAVETITRTIRVFDQGIFVIIKRYRELEKAKK
jgi:monomeric isocitrate dehydrogenase